MRITKLDGLRGVFSLMVVFYHYDSRNLPELISQNFLIRESYTFVDFFFVLSGFVIAYNYRNISSWKDFWAYLRKRFIRLYPLLFYTSIVFFSFEVLFNTYFPEYLNTHESLSSLIRVSLDTLLFTNSTPIFGKNIGINEPSWSISAEMIAYIFFGLASVYAIKKRKSWILLLGIIGAISFSIWNVTYFESPHYGFIRGILAFNVGYFVWLVSEKKFSLPNKLEYLIPVLLGIILYQLNTYALGSMEKEMFGMAIIPLFFGLSILTLIKTRGILSKLLDTRLFQFFGKISYSVYLNHFLLLTIIPRGVFVLLGIPKTATNEVYVLVGTLAIVILYSHYTYKYVEVKGAQLLRRIL